jgi:biotin-dependent carboxylase-like uncharacterized protein
MSLQVLSPGLLTTLQDAGRRGYRQLGVGVSGAADRHSLRLANLLVGNPPDCAALEITLTGPRLRFARAVRIALCGGRIEARCAGVDLPGWQPITLPAGAELELGALRSGCRSYLAIGGGLELQPVLGSASTDLRGGFGGWHGRALARDDRIALRPDPEAVAVDAPQIARWSINPRPDLELADDTELCCVLHLMPGPERSRPAAALTAGEWTVAPASDRQGLRLQGLQLQADGDRQLISSPVLPGTVQLPADGQPILLLADAQTVGGYPRIGQLASADLPRAAQLRPGARLRFAPCSEGDAWRMLQQQRQRLARIELAIAARRSASPTQTR